MGIVSSTLTSVAIRFAWNCQRFLDPRYRSIEPTISDRPSDKSSIVALARVSASLESALVAESPSTMSIDNRAASEKLFPPENGNSLHRKIRRERAARRTYRNRSSSFDGTLMKNNENNPETGKEVPRGLATHSMPNTLKRQPAPSWDSTSSSCSSSDSSDSETELMYASRVVKPNDEDVVENDATIDRSEPTTMDDGRTDDGSSMVDNGSKESTMTAAEEVAFRTTIGRGHLSRSQKDRFLNHLRLEKRLNGLNKEFFESACRAHTRLFRKRETGDLRTIV